MTARHTRPARHRRAGIVLAAFLLVTGVFLLSLYQARRRLAYGLAFVLGLNLLILTRSAFHLVLLLPAVATFAYIVLNLKSLL